MVAGNKNLHKMLFYPLRAFSLCAIVLATTGHNSNNTAPGH